MPTNAQEWREETLRVAGTELSVIQGGTGNAVLVLHEELGHPGWLRWHSELARSHTLLIPQHPGFGKSPRVEWISSIRDLAGFYARVLRERNWRPIDVIGFSLGGWIAAEMAACDAAQFRRMVLVAPTGIRPPEGCIMDMFIVAARAYLDASVYSAQDTPEFAKLYGGEQTPEQFEAWEDARAETARLAWQPYMYNPSLGPLLEGVTGLPTLIIWGKQDQIVPVSAAEVYKKAIAGSELVVFDHCGHRPEIEKQAEFVERVQRFLA
ncbi:MAG: alpha/beta hydrolase [Candidatus Binatia bacterium]|nr:alpha/beta hydrolase [Candidatus Binatia bacterium]